MKNAMKNIIKKLLSIFRLEIKRTSNQKPNPIHLWDEDEEFKVIFTQISPHTLVDKPRCFMLYQVLQHALSVSGDMAEVGVYKGGTARLLGLVAQKKGSNKEISIFDTFSGMPVTDPTKDMHREGDFSDVVLAQVKTLLADLPNVKIYPGFFPESAGAIEQKTFSFVHVDVDIYQSVLDCCKFFYPRLRSGGVMVFDDYGFRSCPGAKMAVDEFFSGTKERPIYLSTGQAMVIKL